MSATALLVVALLLALVSVPSVAGMTAWGLAGGDGEPKNRLFGLLAMLVGYGAMLNVLTCWVAFFRTLPAWQWWLMWAPPVAGVIGLLLSVSDAEDESPRDWLVGIGMQLLLGVPALLVWAADATVA